MIQHGLVAGYYGRKERPCRNGGGSCYTAVAPGQFFVHDGGGNDRTLAAAPIFLGKGRLLNAQICQALKDFVDDLVLLIVVYLLSNRHNLFFDKVAKHLLRHAVFLFEKDTQILLLRHIFTSSQK